MYVPTTRKIISSYDVVFNERLSSALAYTSRLYSEAMAIRPSVTFIPCASRHTDNITTFAQFQESDILTETRDNAESGDEYDDDSTMPPLLSEEEIDAIDSGDESDNDLMSTDMLERIRDGSQYHPNVN